MNSADTTSPDRSMMGADEDEDIQAAIALSLAQGSVDPGEGRFFRVRT